MSMATKTKLIDRSILGVPGTPFALVMSRSLDFVGYDKILLFNFYNNRHVRILLSLCQMAWDSVEASGILAPPLSNPIPRVLIQAGLGDPVVPTIAAEALTRSLGGNTLPNSPREIFGVSNAPAADELGEGPQVTLTELLYEREYKNLPVEDMPARGNGVHYCVRRDSKLLEQLIEFTNTGRVIDPCEQDGCHRSSASC